MSWPVLAEDGGVGGRARAALLVMPPNSTNAGYVAGAGQRHRTAGRGDRDRPFDRQGAIRLN